MDTHIHIRVYICVNRQTHTHTYECTKVYQCIILNSNIRTHSFFGFNVPCELLQPIESYCYAGPNSMQHL